MTAPGIIWPLGEGGMRLIRGLFSDMKHNDSGGGEAARVPVRAGAALCMAMEEQCELEQKGAKNL